MEKQFISLTEHEKRCKRDYLEWSRSYFEKPVTIDQLKESGIADQKSYVFNKSFHVKTSTNNPGNTVVDVAIRGSNVEVVRHSRYCLPILHNHEYIELVYVYSGSGVHFINGKSLEMKEGDLCMLAPDTMHALAVCEDETIVINIMMSRNLFDSAFLHMLRGGTAISEFMENVLYREKVSPYLLFRTGEDEFLHRTVLKAWEEKEQKDYLFSESVALLVKQIFIHLIRHYETSCILDDPENCGQNGSIMAIMNYIATNYTDISLSKVAGFFGYNENHMSKIIHRYTGKTFSSIVSDLQMENAARLLKETKMSITEISSEVGCYDSSHLTRKFKSRFGKSPNQYRKEYGV